MSMMPALKSILSNAGFAGGVLLLDGGQLLACMLAYITIKLALPVIREMIKDQLDHRQVMALMQIARSGPVHAQSVGAMKQKSPGVRPGSGEQRGRAA